MLEQIVVISFIVFAIYSTMEEGMIFGVVRDWWAALTKNWSEEKAEFWSKPVFSCVICMAGWYGTGIYWMLFHNNWQEWLVVVISTIGLNTILSKLFPND